MQIGIKSIKKYLIALLCEEKEISKNSQILYKIKNLIFLLLVKFEIYITGVMTLKTTLLPKKAKEMTNPKMVLSSPLSAWPQSQDFPKSAQIDPFLDVFNCIWNV